MTATPDPTTPVQDPSAEAPETGDGIVAITAMVEGNNALVDSLNKLHEWGAAHGPMLEGIAVLKEVSMAAIDTARAIQEAYPYIYHAVTEYQKMLAEKGS